jgi:hypothetical protein
MYALIHDSQLLLGPIQYNYRLINSDLEELEIEKRVSPRDYQNVPLTIDENTFLLSVEIVVDGEYDARFHDLSSPEWSIVKDENNVPQKVQFTHTPIEKSLEKIKEEYKSLVAPRRWEKENKILTLTINNTEVEVSTDRDERAQFVTKLVSCSNIENATHDYKFRNGSWVTIGCTEIQYILEQIDHEIQEAFDWEYTKLQEIDACVTGQEVYNVSLA